VLGADVRSWRRSNGSARSRVVTRSLLTSRCESGGAPCSRHAGASEGSGFALSRRRWQSTERRAKRTERKRGAVGEEEDDTISVGKVTERRRRCHVIRGWTRHRLPPLCRWLQLASGPAHRGMHVTGRGIRGPTGSGGVRLLLVRAGHARQRRGVGCCLCSGWAGRWPTWEGENEWA
jgi:hypothetical protein